MTAVFMRRRITQGNKRMQTGDRIKTLISFHVLRFINDDDRMGRLDIFNRGNALFTDLVDDVFIFGKGVNVHHKDLDIMTGGKVA